MSIEQMGLMLHSFNAARPTELALQDENRLLKADANRLDIQLLHARAEAASTKQACAISKEELQGTTLANAAPRRGCMVRDMQVMSFEYMQEQAMTGYTCYLQRSIELIEEVTSMHDSMINECVAQEVITRAASVNLFSTSAPLPLAS